MKNQFKNIIFYLTSFALLITLSCDYPNNDVIFFKNGYVFDGSKFVEKDFFVANGVFLFDNRIAASSIVDLKKQYVIPPFGDAHTHNFDDLEKFDSIYKAYVDEGTFYVQVLTNHYSNYLSVKDSLNRPGKIDAKFGHGGITSTGGHPHNLYESQSLGYSWRAMFDPVKREKLLASKTKENDAYYLIDSVSQINKKWKDIISKKPDFIKIYLLNTKSRNKRVSKKRVGTYGLSEEVAAEIVIKAKQSQIKVITHIQSVNDFELALNLGIKHFAHMPGYGGGTGNQDLNKMTIPDSLLRVAASMDISITPTVSFAKYYAMSWDGEKMALDTTLLHKKQAFLKRGLKRFKNAGIDITIGADQNNSTLTEEIDDLIEIGAFSNKELLNILINSSKSIFPNRKIGAIKEGFEASFLVLEGNPIENISHLKNIKQKYKNGIKL